VPKPDVLIRLQPKQAALDRLMERSQATNLGYGGSRGGAKSGGARRVLLKRRYKYPRTDAVIIRRTYPELLDNHINAMWRDFPHLEARYNKGEKTLTLENGSRILFRQAEDEKAVDAYLGKEFQDMYVDQAEAFTENELLKLKSSNRWPGGVKCCMVLGFNPGGRGAAYLKRIFKDQKFKPNERPEDYAFIQAYGWDNIEWSRPWLRERGITERQYYRDWSDEERKQCFLQHSDYARTMLAAPKSLIAGWLYGDFDNFAGQYFDNFDPARHVRRYGELGIEPWHQRWIAIDWGFAHNTSVHWYAKTPTHVAVYDELVVNRTNEAELARMIADKSRGQTITRCFISPDTAAKKGTAKPTKEQIGVVLKERGLPYPQDADNARVSGWRLVYSMLGREGEQPQLLIADTCPRLVQCLPMMTRDPEKPEDCEKFDSNEDGEGGDDCADELRYGLKSYFGDSEVPREVQFQNLVAAAGERTGEPVNNTIQHLMALRFNETWKKMHGPLRRPLRRRH
jgi:phage terminase large subunit